MARFWRFKSDEFKGEFFYVDPTEIVGVSHEREYDGEGNDCHVITLKSGDEYYVHDPDDVRRLIRWAEFESEAIPELSVNAMAWK